MVKRKENKMNKEDFVNAVKEQTQIAKDALKKICELADGVDGNVCFLAIHELKQLDRIPHCAELKGTVPNMDAVEKSNQQYARKEMANIS